MPFDSIHKDLKAMRVTPHLVDYDQARTTHSWEAMRAEMQGLRSGGLNLAHEAVDRHATGVRANHLALRWLGKDGGCARSDLCRHGAWLGAVCNVLRTLGVVKGERVFALMGRVPELYYAALGTLKNVSVFCPLFSQFGPEPVWQRLSRGDAKVLVTTKALYEKKVAALRERLPALQCILLADAEDDLDATVRSLPKLMAAASDEFVIPPTSPEDMALLHFTSGTTGMPKGAVHVHQAALTHFATGVMCSICIPMTFSGAPPIPAGSRARRMASSRRCCMA
jgi:acetyl-CoA synthetase